MGASVKLYVLDTTVTQPHHPRVRCRRSSCHLSFGSIENSATNQGKVFCCVFLATSTGVDLIAEQANFTKITCCHFEIRRQQNYQTKG